jgi:hypothetical protein
MPLISRTAIMGDDMDILTFQAIVEPDEVPALQETILPFQSDTQIHESVFALLACVQCAYVHMRGRPGAEASASHVPLDRLYRACLLHSHAMLYEINARRKSHSMPSLPFSMSGFVGALSLPFEDYIAVTCVTFLCGCRMASTPTLIRVRLSVASLPDIDLIRGVNKRLQSCYQAFASIDLGSLSVSHPRAM